MSGWDKCQVGQTSVGQTSVALVSVGQKLRHRNYHLQLCQKLPYLLEFVKISYKVVNELSTWKGGLSCGLKLAVLTNLIFLILGTGLDDSKDMAFNKIFVNYLKNIFELSKHWVSWQKYMSLLVSFMKLQCIQYILLPLPI